MDLFHAGEQSKSYFWLFDDGCNFFYYYFFIIIIFYGFHSFEVKQFSPSRSVRNNNLAQMMMAGVAS